ncbi:MAG: hypothetical protein J6R80_06040 [Kiritimatiellae bacterium]|nr:hypothetical protein [Kiritimatiellia bacterium]
MEKKISQDLKDWYALSCPVEGLRFDKRTLELLDTDGDGFIRSEEIRAALAFLAENGIGEAELFSPAADAQEKLDAVMQKIAALADAKPSEDWQKAVDDWQSRGSEAQIAVCGDSTPEAFAALTAVEPIIDEFFTPPADLPLVTDEPDVVLPLAERINPKHIEAIRAFADLCVKPILGDLTFIDRTQWKKLKSAFAPFREWQASKPVPNAPEMTALVSEERLARYRLYLGEFLSNFIIMDRLYSGKGEAIFQTGVLRIDGKELNLCFHVASEAAHSALVGKSNCCVVYAKLSRPSEKLERIICAVVTAGTISGLYAGRNGVFYDRDGKDWQATLTRVVETQVSLAEAFWAPWRKFGETISDMVKKFLGSREAAAGSKLNSSVQVVTAGKAADKGAGGAAFASSLAALGIGIGMLGAAAASVLAVVKGMGPWQIIASIVSIILFVSMPSVALTWFKLRRRDIGAILNASGWAINKQMRFSMALGRIFTKCARTSVWWLFVLAFVILASLATYTAWYFISSTSCSADEVEAQECYVEGEASEAALTSETKGE